MKHNGDQDKKIEGNKTKKGDELNNKVRQEEEDQVKEFKYLRESFNEIID